MRIYVDFDDCLCETAKSFSDLAVEMFDKHVPYENIRFFELDKSFELDADQFERFMTRGHEPDVLLSYEETPGASEVINEWISKGHEVLIITGRPFSAYEPSRKWLDDHGLQNVKLYCLNKYGRDSFSGYNNFSLELEDYYKMHFDFAIEDSPKAFRFFDHLPNLRVLVFDRPWNRDCTFPNDNYTRCFDWESIRKIVDETKQERVELHAHTKMSGFDSVIDTKELIETALKMGHKAVAITDHGCVYALPEAANALERLANKPEYKDAAKGFKIIYGCEGYLVNDDDLTDDNGNLIISETDYDEEIKNRAYTHVTLLCRNETGRKNMYRLVSESHIKYFGKGRPRMPKSLLNKYREGLLLGSACDMGELFKALLRGKSREEIEHIAEFYDYLEIQPVENYAGAYITNEAYPGIKSKEDLWKLNITITEIAEKQNKLCIAASDAHFIAPADERYRKIARYISAVRRDAVAGFKETDDALFFRTTDDMVQSLKEHMDEEKAFAIAVTNTRKISDMIEYISPVGDEGSHLEFLSYDKALEYVKEYCAYKNIRLSEEETGQAAERLSGMRIHLG